MKLEKLIFGLFFIFAAFAVLAGPLGFLPSLDSFQVFITILLLYWFIKSAIHLDFGGVIFSSAFFFIIYAEEFAITNISPWPILFAAILINIGISYIFPTTNFGHRHCKSFKHHDDKYMDKIIDENDEQNIEVLNNFSGVAKYVNVKGLQSVLVKSSFGGVSLYLDKVTLDSNGATINFDISFSGVEVHVPKEWKVVNNVHTNLAGVDEKNNHINKYDTNNTDKSKILKLEGYANLSGIEIIYC